MEMEDLEDDTQVRDVQVSRPLQIFTDKMNSTKEYKNYQRIYEVMLENKDFKRHRVLLIRTGLHKSSNDLYFYPFYKLMKSTTSAVQVIYNNMSDTTLKCGRVPTNLTDFQEVGRFIPMQICGLFRSSLYITRSFYTMFRAITKMRKFKPTLIIVDSCVFAVPFLKFFSPCPVIYLHYYQDVTIDNQIPMLYEHNSFAKLFINFFLNKSDEILLPSQAAKVMFLNNFDIGDCIPIMVNPLPYMQIEYGSHNWSTLHKYYSFMVTGIWDERSNFRFAISTWKIFLNRISSDTKRKDLHLYICGFFDETNMSQRNCRSSIIQLINDEGLNESISHVTNLTNEEKLYFYRACSAMLNLRERDFFNMALLEAQYFGLPIISVRSAFANDIITHGKNGYLVDLNIVHIADVMLNIIPQTFKMKQTSRSYYGNNLGPMPNDMKLRELMKKYLPLASDEEAANIQEPRQLNWGPLMFYMKRNFGLRKLYVSKKTAKSKNYYLNYLKKHADDSEFTYDEVSYFEDDSSPKYDELSTSDILSVHNDLSSQTIIEKGSPYDSDDLPVSDYSDLDSVDDDEMVNNLSLDDNSDLEIKFIKRYQGMEDSSSDDIDNIVARYHLNPELFKDESNDKVETSDTTSLDIKNDLDAQEVEKRTSFELNIKNDSPDITGFDIQDDSDEQKVEERSLYNTVFRKDIMSELEIESNDKDDSSDISNSDMQDDSETQIVEECTSYNTLSIKDTTSEFEIESNDKEDLADIYGADIQDDSDTEEVDERSPHNTVSIKDTTSEFEIESNDKEDLADINGADIQDDSDTEEVDERSPHNTVFIKDTTSELEVESNDNEDWADINSDSEGRASYHMLSRLSTITELEFSERDDSSDEEQVPELEAESNDKDEASDSSNSDPELNGLDAQKTGERWSDNSFTSINTFSELETEAKDKGVSSDETGSDIEHDTHVEFRSTHSSCNEDNVIAKDDAHHNI